MLKVLDAYLSVFLALPEIERTEYIWPVKFCRNDFGNLLTPFEFEMTSGSSKVDLCTEPESTRVQGP
jgi:hypothetical protein